MFLLNPTGPGTEPDLIFSATDLVNASVCEYRTLRILDEKLGRSVKPVFETDEMLERTAVLGDVHERRILDQFVAKHGAWDPAHGTGVYDVVPASGMDRTALTQKHSESIDALRSGADVVFQAAFFDGLFHGRSDFLVKADGGYAVWDTKLARHAKVGALLQLAAYGDQLLKENIRPAPLVTLVLGDDQHSNHRLADLLPVYQERRDRFLSLVEQHRRQAEPVAWGNDSHTACGRCEYCQLMVEESRDLLLVGRMSTTRRATLHKSGVFTIDELAAMEIADEDESLLALRDQARMQTGAAEIDGSVPYTDKHGDTQTLSFRVLEKNGLGSLPEPDNGDIFFDFEGDPLWQDATGRWGIEYLFGVVENASEPGGEPPFRPFWAHDRAQERQAFADFLDYVAERRRRYPNLHIYHYASYEKTALRNLSLIHLIGEDAVDTLLRDGVLVDLYETVRNSLRISDRSYSIKKLEPLYMGSNLRSGDVTDAGASVVAYAQYCEARDRDDTELAEKILTGISDYNRYDCLSTLELRNWLLKLAAERGIGPAKPQEPAVDTAEPPSPAEQRLLDHVGSLPTHRALTDDEQAMAMVAAAVGYHRREDKQFWWEHFDRLGSPIDQWAEKQRDVFIVRHASVVQDWAKPTSRSNHVRTLDLCGIPSEGSEFKPGSKWFRMYGAPLPCGLEPLDGRPDGRDGWFETEVLEGYADRDDEHLIVLEKVRKGVDLYPQTPIALTPDKPIPTVSIRAALAELAQSVGATLPALPKSPGVEILRRADPTLSGRASLPPVDNHEYIPAITAAVEALDRSYLAVQGPPGTGKTYVGSHVICQLVQRGWKVGVVAQSHAVVENMLKAALKAGVPAHKVAKRTSDADAPWAYTTDDDVASLLTADGGALVGGTAWTMTGSKVPPESLDLLVIDEAGQFSLANTLAVSRAAKRLLLLGDPQQLPQVTQANHPEPVDESALGWLSQGRSTLPPELGYFLADSWRMHPDLCAAVSSLAYDDKLESTALATKRVLEGPPAGVECVLVNHTGNASASSEEAEEVVRQVQRHLGAQWHDAENDPRPLTDADVLVVAAYNAQVQMIRRKLSDAGLHGTRVGTVDKFQGQEAPVVIVSMACSSAAEAPRGIQFLLNRNRINVAISRGQWRAVIIRSPELTHHLPSRPAYFEELGAFIGLCQNADANQFPPQFGSH